MRYGLAAKILIPFAVFLAAVAVLGDVFIVALGDQVLRAADIAPQAAAAVRTLALTYVLVSLLSVLLLLGIYMLIVRSITRRLAVLTTLTEQVEADAFPALVTVEGHDEIADLTRAFVAMNTRLERSYRRLEEAQRLAARHEKLASLGALASSVAHEINNPNGIISLYAQLLLRRDDLSAEARQQAATVAAESARLAHIVRDLLDYARPAAPLQHAPVDLGALLRDLLAAQRPLLGDVALTADGDLAVTGDAARLRQVFINLLVNARDAAGEAGSVRVQAAGGAAAVTVRVSDDGPGIPRHLQEKVFEPFFTTKTTGKGSGLGLAICHRIIVEEHGGSIDLQAADSGTTVLATLPRGRTDE